MIGRGLRFFPGKKNCLFIDFVDNSSKHRLISMQDLLMFYQTKRIEKNIAELLARKLAKKHQNEQTSLVIDLSPTNLPLLVNLENLSSSVKEIDLFGLDAFAWYTVQASHYVQVNDVFSLVVRPYSHGHILYAAFPKAGFYAPLLDESVEFDLAYGCGNAYLFDYGDRHLATKGSQWRNENPTEDQRNLFRRLRDKIKDISAGSISFDDPSTTKGEYGAAIAALNSEMILLSGRRIESQKAKEFIKKQLHARVAGDESISVTINDDVDPTIEVALKRAIQAFSHSKEGDFLNYLKKILLKNQILVHGNHVKISHIAFPGCMSERQIRAVTDRIQQEIRLYVPDAEIVLSGFRVFNQGL